MSIRTVHLVGCDRCPNSEHLPMHCYSPAQARHDAKGNGWKRVRVSAEIGIPAHFDDVCPTCATTEPTGGPQ